jgi:rhomboid protease GluP
MFPLREQSGVIASPLVAGLLVGLGTVVGYFVTAGALLGALELLALLAAVGGAVLGGALTWLLVSRLKRTVTPAPLEVTDALVRLPRSARSVDRVELALTDIRSVEARGTRKAPLVVLGTTRGFFAYPMRAFLEEDAPASLRDTIRAALRALPDGARLVDDMEHLEEEGRIVARKRPRATQVLLGVIAGVFVFSLTAGSPSDAKFMLRWGANAPALVEEGQWWRLFVAGFMHLSFVHFFLNATALLSLGSVVEKLVGAPRFLLIALGASIAGNAASMLTHSHLYSAGTSSLIFGLIGALFIINVRFGRALPAGFMLGTRRWLTLLGVNGLVSLLPGVDGLAHLGGLLGGALLCLALVQRVSLEHKHINPFHIAGASALCAAFLIAFLLSGAHALTLDDKRELRDVAWSALSTTGLPPERMHEVVYAILQEQDLDPLLLDRAERVMTELSERLPGNADFRDTLERVRERRQAVR